MNKNILKKIFFFSTIFLALFSFSAAIVSVYAEDDEAEHEQEEEHQEDEEDEEDDDDDDRRSSETYVSQTPEVKTDVSTKVIILKDSDGDGLLDSDDPHPAVAEIYIVKDDNLNGIVDDFEK